MLRNQPARVAELADAPDLGSGGEIRRGSSPLPGTLMRQQTSRDKNIRTNNASSFAFETADVQQQRRDIEKAAGRRLLDLLTPREFDVMQLVVTSMLNKQIASELGT